MTFDLCLSFPQEPSAGLDTFDSYRIFVSPPPPPPLISPIVVPKTSISGMYLLRGLANFTTYTITVATSNQDGVGPLTASHTATTPETGVYILLWKIGTCVLNLLGTYQVKTHSYSVKSWAVLIKCLEANAQQTKRKGWGGKKEMSTSSRFECWFSLADTSSLAVTVATSYGHYCTRP